MNQKNVFTGIAAILLLQGCIFYLMGNKISSESFPNLDETGRFATVKLFEVISMTSIIVGLISYASRNTPQVLWAYTVGFSLFSLNTLKHLVIDHINVPVPAMLIQIGIALVCGYLWMQNNKVQTA